MFDVEDGSENMLTLLCVLQKAKMFKTLPLLIIRVCYLLLNFSVCHPHFQKQLF